MASLFRLGDGYLGTELLRQSDDPGEYLTLDRWSSRAAYRAFRDLFGDEYRELDERLEGLTREEAFLGTYRAPPT